jgi:hypothetical protein
MKRPEAVARAHEAISLIGLSPSLPDDDKLRNPSPLPPRLRFLGRCEDARTSTAGRVWVAGTGRLVSGPPPPASCTEASSLPGALVPKPKHARRPEHDAWLYEEKMPIKHYRHFLYKEEMPIKHCRHFLYKEEMPIKSIIGIFSIKRKCPAREPCWGRRARGPASSARHGTALWPYPPRPSPRMSVRGPISSRHMAAPGRARRDRLEKRVSCRVGTLARQQMLQGDFTTRWWDGISATPSSLVGSGNVELPCGAFALRPVKVLNFLFRAELFVSPHESPCLKMHARRARGTRQNQLPRGY